MVCKTYATLWRGQLKLEVSPLCDTLSDLASSPDLSSQAFIACSIKKQHFILQAIKAWKDKSGNKARVTKSDAS